MKRTTTILRRALLSAACLLPLALHAQDASRQAPAPTTVAGKPCTSCPPQPIPCTFTDISATSWNGFHVPLQPNGVVCQFDFVYLNAVTSGAVVSYNWQIITPASGGAESASATNQATFSFRVIKPNPYPYNPNTRENYLVRCTVVCQDGLTTVRDFAFQGKPRDYAACGEVVRMTSTPPPTLEIYPSPATEQVSLVLEGGSQAVLLNGSGKEVRRITLRDGKADLSVADLPRGLYQVRVTSANGKVVDKRFSVEH